MNPRRASSTRTADLTSRASRLPTALPSRRPIGPRALFLVVMLALAFPRFVADSRPAEAAFPGINGKIAFHTDRDGNYDIYALNADGSGEVRLTSNAANDQFPAWSPDGTKIAFLSNRDDPLRNTRIYVMNADGSGQTRVSADQVSASPLTWSPDGTKLAFNSGAETSYPELHIVNVDGTGRTRVTDNPGADTSPAWSPDGSKIAFDCEYNGDVVGTVVTEICVTKPDGSGLTRLTYDQARSLGPDWSPDGKKIAFYSLRNGNYDLYVMNADGSGQARLTTDPPGASIGDGLPVWSPDGTKVAFTRVDGLTGIWLMNADGSGQTQILPDPRAYAHSWQPLKTRGPAVTVSRISPASGPSAGGTVVTIEGGGFSTTSRATGVRFGTNPATNVACSSATQCTATSPPGSGSVDVTVTVGGQASAAGPAGRFTYIAAPAAKTTLRQPAKAGSRALKVVSVTGFAVGDTVRINPAGRGEESGRVVKVRAHELLLADPLRSAHRTGEEVARATSP